MYFDVSAFWLKKCYFGPDFDVLGWANFALMRSLVQRVDKTKNEKDQERNLLWKTSYSLGPVTTHVIGWKLIYIWWDLGEIILTFKYRKNWFEVSEMYGYENCLSSLLCQVTCPTLSLCYSAAYKLGGLCIYVCMYCCIQLLPKNCASLIAVSVNRKKAKSRIPAGMEKPGEESYRKHREEFTR